MSKGLAGVKTLTAKQIADKWKLPLAVVSKKIAAGVKVEKEHTTSTRQANEIARDHLGERPDYYDKLDKMEKTKVVKEESTTTGIAGLGFVTGTPAIDSDNQYIDTNVMSYDDINGGILELIRKKHNQHLIDMGFSSYSPNDLQTASNRVIKEAKLNELGEYENKNGTTDTEGLSDPHPKVLRKNIDINNIKEDLRKWFREKWVRYDTKGNIKGPCAREEGEGKPKCQPLASARAMSKKERAKSARRKRREDPVADRSGKGGKPINVQTEETLLEKNVPTNPSLWARAKAQARSKFDVYPSAYANGWASKWYKSKGGGWKTAANESIEEQSPANVSYKERPLYERGKVPADMTDATARGIYQEASADINEISDTLVGAANNATFWKGRTPSKRLERYVRRAQLRDPEEIKKKEKIKKKDVKEDANRPDRDLEAKTYTGATGTTKTIHEETKMDNKELINEALDCILEDNLPEMKDNLMKALQEKAIEKLEERKKEIAANYFAQ